MVKSMATSTDPCRTRILQVRRLGITSSMTMRWVGPCAGRSPSISALSQAVLYICRSPSGPTGCYDQACRRLLRGPRAPEKPHRHRSVPAGGHFVLSPTPCLGFGNNGKQTEASRAVHVLLVLLVNSAARRPSLAPWRRLSG